MSLKEIKKVNVSGEVYKQILAEIVSKKLKPGDKLPSESELVQSFGVSRISVRSALQRLAGAGIIESVSGGGTYVKYLQQGSMLNGIVPMAVLDNYDANQLVDFRRGIETVAAELAARFGTAEEIKELKLICLEMERLKDENAVEEYSEQDLAFHMHIAKMSRNPFIIYVMEQLKDIFHVHILKLNQDMGCSDGFNFHKHIYERIAAHDQKGAREYMNLNLMNSQQRVVMMDE